MTNFFAAYDDNAIQAIGTTPEAAIAHAESFGAWFCKTAPISDALFHDIMENGWDGFSRAFGINADGYVVEVA